MSGIFYLSSADNHDIYPNQNTIMFRFNLSYQPLTFKRPSGTSRGVLTDKHAWYITISSDENPTKGVGEVSVIPGLTQEFIEIESYQKWLNNQIIELNNAKIDELSFQTFIQKWYDKPSFLFGLEIAYADFLSGGKALFYDTSFTRKETSIPINGLIWMGDESFMQEQIEEKLQAGFTCIKTKIGAIDFETEMKLLTSIRQRYSKEQMILRVDANGAFSPSEALDKLQRLADLDIHSIEQPIRAGQWIEMKQLCEKTPCPIALDEELIGVYDTDTKKKLLDTIRPQYIILKPSLHGGIRGCQEWIALAEERQIPWWITSALESNVGLNMIAQFVSTYHPTMHQGLGTGGLYVKNTEPTTVIQKGEMYFL